MINRNYRAILKNSPPLGSATKPTEKSHEIKGTDKPGEKKEIPKKENKSPKKQGEKKKPKTEKKSKSKNENDGWTTVEKKH